MRHRMFWGAGLIAAVLLVTGCQPNSMPPSPTVTPAVSVPVTLTLSGPAAQADIRIGLVMPPVQGEGSEYRDAAEGAEVAAYRFGLSGAKVTLVTAQDDGTSAGVQTAIQSLAAQSVSGIVAATAGPHLDQALAAMNLATPLLLPYDSSAPPASGMWTTGPSQASIASGLEQGLQSAGVSHPFVLTQTGWTAPSGIKAADTAQVNPGDPLPAAVMADLNASTADSVVIAASAATQAALVTAIQQSLGTQQVPVFVTPEALSPAFGDAVAQAGAAGAVLTTVGADADDPAALGSDLTGQRAAAYFLALRLAAGDQACKTVFGDAAFSSVAQDADIASHDAVVALVRAVEKAGTTSPANVLTALPGLTLSKPADGLAGPILDFSTGSALPDGDVVPLFASTQNPGVRPETATGARQLFWFSTK